MKWISILLDGIAKLFTSCSTLKCHSTCCDAEFEMNNEHHEEEIQEEEKEEPQYIKHYDKEGNLNIVEI